MASRGVVQTYTYNKSLMQSELAVIEPREWLVVEGLFVLCYPAVADLADVKAYIDASPEVDWRARKHRDMTVRGYAPKGSNTNGSTMCALPDLAHIQRPCRASCDVVGIDNDEDWRAGLAQLIEQMEALNAGWASHGLVKKAFTLPTCRRVSIFDDSPTTRLRGGRHRGQRHLCRGPRRHERHTRRFLRGTVQPPRIGLRSMGLVDKTLTGQDYRKLVSRSTRS